MVDGSLPSNEVFSLIRQSSIVNRRLGVSMAEVRMPKMGDSMEEGTILRWIKREGDSIAVDESIAEVETDKANVEIPAEEAGTLTKIVVSEGHTVAVGAVIAFIGDGTG